MRKSRISEIIGDIDPKYVHEAAGVGEAKAVGRLVWMKWVAMAACVVLMVVFGIGLFGGNVQVATLDDGSKLRFVKSESGGEQLDIEFEIRTRNLTEDEIANLFGELPVTGYALFNHADNRILGIEGQIESRDDTMNLIVSAPGICLNDTVLEGEESVSDVNGVAVWAGYFTSGKNIIYYATFALGESTVYIEHGGRKSESSALRKDIAQVIQKMAALEQMDLSSVSR